jgi:tRNA-binding EMAP/Myf-like protein
MPNASSPAPGEDPLIDDKEKGGKPTYENRKQQNDNKKKQKPAKDNNSNKNAPAVSADPSLPDICKLEFKVGLITKVWVHPDAEKLYCEEIDCGEEGGLRQIASGLRKHYKEEEMLGKRVLVVANLKVRVVPKLCSGRGLVFFHFLDYLHRIHMEVISLSFRRKI